MTIPSVAMLAFALTLIVMLPIVVVVGWMTGNARIEWTGYGVIALAVAYLVVAAAFDGLVPDILPLLGYAVVAGAWARWNVTADSPPFAPRRR